MIWPTSMLACLLTPRLRIPVATRDDPTTFWAQIDVDVLKSASPLWSFPANLRIQGKSSRVLTQLTEAIERSATPDFRATVRKRIEKLTADQKRDFSVSLPWPQIRDGSVRSTRIMCVPRSVERSRRTTSS